MITTLRIAYLAPIFNPISGTKTVGLEPDLV